MTTLDHIKEKTNRGWNIFIPAIITALVLIFNTVYTAGAKSSDLATVQSDIIALKTVEPRLTTAMVSGDNAISGKLASDRIDIEVLKSQRSEDHERLIRIERTLMEISRKLK